MPLFLNFLSFFEVFSEVVEPNGTENRIPQTEVIFSSIFKVLFRFQYGGANIKHINIYLTACKISCHCIVLDPFSSVYKYVSCPSISFMLMLCIISFSTYYYM